MQGPSNDIDAISVAEIDTNGKVNPAEETGSKLSDESLNNLKPLMFRWHVRAPPSLSHCIGPCLC